MIERLLTKTEAARYCSLTPAAFMRICPVPGIELADKTRRWDRAEIDEWIDGLRKSPKTDEDWLEKLRNDETARRERRKRQGH